MTTSPVLSLGIAVGLIIVFGTGCMMTTLSGSVETNATNPLSSIPENLADGGQATTSATHAPEKGPGKSDLFLGEDSLYYRMGSEAPFTGKAEILSAYSELFYEGQFKDGLREGEGIERHEDGHKKYVGQWKAGKFFTGTVYYYYAGTDLVSLQGGYIEGQLVSGINLDRTGQSY